jgi:hypothetical protein
MNMSEFKANNKNKQSNNFRRFIQRNALLIGAFSLVIVLVFIFKNQDIVEVYETGKQNVKQFYADNFKPLISKTPLTNEDIFNFALYKNVPLDKQDKSILQIGENEGEIFTYEVYPDVYKDNTDNFKKFNDYFKLSDKEQNELDSIFSIYRKKLDRSILLADKNQFAFNTNLDVIHEALLVDMLSYLNNVRPKMTSGFFSTDYFDNNRSIAEDFLRSVNVDSNDNYIVFIEDSVFTKSLTLIPNPEIPDLETDLEYEVDPEINSVGFRIAVKVPDKVKLNSPEEIAWYRVNPRYSKVVLEKPIEKEILKKSEKLRECISKASKKIRNLEFHIQLDEEKNGDFTFTTEYTDSGEVHSFQFNTGDLQKIIETSLSGLDFSDIDSWEEYGARWEQYGLKLDSLANIFENTYRDSMEVNLEDLEIDLQKLKKEIEAKKRDKQKHKADKHN